MKEKSKGVKESKKAPQKEGQRGSDPNIQHISGDYPGIGDRFLF